MKGSLRDFLSQDGKEGLRRYSINMCRPYYLYHIEEELFQKILAMFFYTMESEISKLYDESMVKDILIRKICNKI